VLAASLNLRDAQIKAPIDGVMQTRSVETGQYVQPGLMLGTLLRRDPLLLRFDVSTQDAPRIKPGMIAKFTMRESQRTYEAKITLVSGSADVKSHLVEVTGEVDDKEHNYWLRPGAFCDVTLGVGATRLSPVVPETAIRPDQRGFLAYVVVGNVAKERVLKLGMHTANGLVEVTEGLQPGDMLVVRGAEPLADGTPVKVTTTSTIALGSAAASLAPSSSAPPPASANATGSPSVAKKHEGK
jgi:RND family efflux transporter MFP subunit